MEEEAQHRSPPTQPNETASSAVMPSEESPDTQGLSERDDIPSAGISEGYGQDTEASTAQFTTPSGVVGSQHGASNGQGIGSKDPGAGHETDAESADDATPKGMAGQKLLRWDMSCMCSPSREMNVASRPSGICTCRLCAEVSWPVSAWMCSCAYSGTAGACGTRESSLCKAGCFLSLQMHTCCCSHRDRGATSLHQIQALQLLCRSSEAVHPLDAKRAGANASKDQQAASNKGKAWQGVAAATRGRAGDRRRISRHCHTLRSCRQQPNCSQWP